MSDKNSILMHKDVPEEIMQKIIVASNVWNEEIRPHFLKGMVRGYLLGIGKLSKIYLPESPDPIADQQEELWKVVYSQLDGLAREVDDYDFGLPMGGDEQGTAIDWLKDNFTITKKV